MSSTEPNLDGSIAEQEAAELSRREKAKLETDNRSLHLTNLMLRAGLDPDDGMGKLFFNGYQGEMTLEAIKASATESGILKAEGEPAPVGTPEEIEALRRSTQERQQTAAGSVPDGGVTNADEDPRVVAVREGELVMANGGSQDAAMSTFFDVVAEAGYGGDKRAQWEPGKDDPRRPDQGW